MKKFTSIILCAVFLLTLCSCGGGKPEDMSDAMYQIGLNALATADQYIAGEITGDDAYDRLEEYYTQAEAQEQSEMEELGVSTLFNTKYDADSRVSHYILILQCDVGDAKFGSGPMSDVKESRDNLAETLGK